MGIKSVDQHLQLANYEKHVNDFHLWQEKIVKDNQFQCKSIPFSESTEWHFREGVLKHRMNGFFYISGIKAEARYPALNEHQQIIINQHQIALNSFLMRETQEGPEFLFQGRVEPGNIGGMQLAPTVQSTQSNYNRLHGGNPTPMIDWFLKKKLSGIVYDELQSEEATRYYGKYNRNLVVQVDFDTEIEEPENFRWFNMESIRSFAITDNILNTDARSILSCVDWDLLVSEKLPFEGHPAGGFGTALQKSYGATADNSTHSVSDLLWWLTKHRVHCGLRTQTIRLDETRNWIVKSDRIREIEERLGFQVCQFSVKAANREVPSWDQPLIVSNTTGRLTLVSQEKNGLLQFLVKASHEVGFLEGVQIGPAISIPPGWNANSVNEVEQFLLKTIESDNGVKIIQQCRQSEEGGRFHQDENYYEIVLFNPSINVPESDLYRWTTLSQLRELVKIPGILTIEMRGVMALLLAYI